jgi:hypothetical protein
MSQASVAKQEADRDGMLDTFVTFLGEHGLVDTRVLDDITSYISGFDPAVEVPRCQNTDRAVSLTLMAGCFGYDHGFEFEERSYRPASPDLKKRVNMYNKVERSGTPLPESFRAGDFLEFFKGKDDTWLFVYTSLVLLVMSAKVFYPKMTAEDILDSFTRNHEQMGKALINRAFEDLKAIGAFSPENVRLTADSELARVK